MRIALIDTTSPVALGSMRRYRDLTVSACRSVAPELRVTPVSVAMPAALWSLRPAFLATWLNHAWMVGSCRRVARERWDLFHLLDGSHAYLMRSLPSARTVVTVHDLIPWRQTQGHFPGSPAPSWPARRLIGSSLSRLHGAAGLIAVSSSTKSDLTDAAVSGSRVRVVLSAWDPHFAPASSVEQRRESNLLLHVGHAGFYKNRMTVLSVLSVLADEGPWRCTLAGAPLTPQERRLIGSGTLARRITVAPLLDDAALATLYSTASVLLFPSLCEGFGWPPLEAMACGCPVVCSNAASLPEIVGDAALTADPLDVAALAGHCRRLHDTPALADDLRQRGFHNVKRFSLASMGEGLVSAYRAALSGREKGEA